MVNAFLLAAAILPAALVTAHDHDLAERAYLARRHLLERQTHGTVGPPGAPAAPAVPPPAPPAVPPPASTTTLPGTPALPGATTTAPASGSTSITLATPLASTNPTAIPLASIVSLQPSAQTIPIPATPAAGTVPTFLPAGVPGLPDAVTISTKDYPTPDVIPPTDSPQVLQWIKEVALTGIVIPNFDKTVDGGCAVAGNSAFATDQSRCWWTCGGCTRTTDITACPTTNDWGLTYDDGPAPYTPNLLAYLDQQNLKSTFFVVGSRVVYAPRTLQYEFITQHQVAVHTWSHHPLTQMSNEEIIAELGWSKKIIKDTLGVTPNMMRPPYGDIDDRVRAISMAMGLTPVMWTRLTPTSAFDTDDFNLHFGKSNVTGVLKNWEGILSNVTNLKTGFIVLEHDLWQESVEVATGYILPDALAHKPPFKIQPVSACLGKPLANAYIETNDNNTNPPALSAALAAHVFSTTSVSPSATGLVTSGSNSTGGGGAGGSSGKKSTANALTAPVFGAVALVLGIFGGGLALL